LGIFSHHRSLLDAKVHNHNLILSVAFFVRFLLSQNYNKTPSKKGSLTFIPDLNQSSTEQKHNDRKHKLDHTA
jgi:hypothetical protein